MGRAILPGLEFLVAGDIIRTVVVDPTLDNVLVLGLIALIRTFLSMTLQLELEGDSLGSIAISNKGNLTEKRMNGSVERSPAERAARMQGAQVSVCAHAFSAAYRRGAPKATSLRSRPEEARL